MVTSFCCHGDSLDLNCRQNELPTALYTSAQHCGTTLREAYKHTTYITLVWYYVLDEACAAEYSILLFTHTNMCLEWHDYMSVYDLYILLTSSIDRCTCSPKFPPVLNYWTAAMSIVFCIQLFVGGNLCIKHCVDFFFTHSNMFCIKIPVTTPLTYSIIGILNASFLTQIILYHPNILMTWASIMQLHQLFAATWIMVFPWRKSSTASVFLYSPTFVNQELSG